MPVRESLVVLPGWRQMYRPIVVVGLTVSGMSLGWMPALADGTAAGTPIVNQATTTYYDGPDPNTSTQFEGVSNTITVTVSKVAGLEVTSDGVNDTTGDPTVVDNGDILEFDFVVKNVGNDSTFVFIPGADHIGVIGGFIQTVQVVARNTTTFTSAVEIPATGISTEDPSVLTDLGLLAAGDTYRVRVRVRVQATTPGQTIRVQFGDTADNTGGTQNDQNIADDGDASAANNPQLRDVRTIADGDAPVNGEREAAAAQTVTLGAVPLAQVRLLLTGTQNDGGNPNSASDNLITYNYQFQVGNTHLGSYTVGSLAGTDITLDTSPADRILISNAIPPNTVWNGAPITPPTNWQVVYTTNDPTVTGDNPLEAAWTTTPPAPAQVKRIGFIYNATANGPLPPGTDVSGFAFTVITSGLPPTGGDVANIGQILGTTSGDAYRKLVYDESGDQAYNNYPDGPAPADPTAPQFDPDTSLGIGDPAVADPGNNTGTGPGGTALVLSMGATSSSIYNGPQGFPQAIGPTNIHDDFTNLAATVPAGQVGPPGALADPGPVSFTNTLFNPHGGTLNNIVLKPLSPAQATAATGGSFGVNTDIPTGTTVTVTYNGASAIYTFDGTVFNLTTGPAVVVPSLGGGASVTYQVTVDLPDNTPQVQGYGVPMVAFVDTGDGTFVPADDPIFNLTVNRVYAQFIRLVKEIQVYDSSGNVKLPFTSTPGTVDLRPGDRIAYRITYTNISTPQGTGSNNRVLTAYGLRIDENGTAGGNTWGTSTTHFMGTTITQGTVEFFNGATSLGSFDSTTLASGDPASGAVVSRYLNIIDQLDPGQGGALLFRRSLN